LRGDGVTDLGDALAAAVARADAAPAEPTHRLIELRPEADEVLVEREEDAWRVHHARSERLVARFDLSNEAAMAFVQERLDSYGVEGALAKAGARAGDEVRIGEVALEYTPDGDVGGR
jgi:GTP-binding protein